MDNRQVADIFAAMADILAIQGENIHRINAYRRAAENIAALSRPLEEVWRAGEVDTIPGIGTTLAEKIDELMRTGRLEAYEKLKAQVPEGVVAMLQMPDVGPRKAALFWQERGITSIEANWRRQRGLVRLQSTCRAWAPAPKRRCWRASRRSGDAAPACNLGVAWELAYRAPELPLRELAGRRAGRAPAGSLRRMRETVGDLDLLVAAEDPEPVMARFREPARRWPRCSSAERPRPRSAPPPACRPTCGCCPPQRWGTALQYFTGSQAAQHPPARAWPWSAASRSASTRSSGRTARELLCAD
jgi:DNA polymerase (family 10)